MAQRRLHLRLLHDGAQPGPPLDEPLVFGLQDGRGEVHAGLPLPAGRLGFDLVLDVVAGKTGAPAFRGSFAHGPPAARFLYLSWKRHGEHLHPWGWRLKIPLSGLDWPLVEAAGQDGMRLVADITGRRPHSSAPIAWNVVGMTPPA